MALIRIFGDRARSATLGCWITCDQPSPVERLWRRHLCHARAQSRRVASLPVTNNHALIDGNKRLGWLCTVVLCDLNGFSLDLSDDEAFQLVWDVAGSSIGVPEIAERLRLGPN